MSGWLYRCYDAGWRLLYIGMTRRAPGAREVEHERDSWWWSEVARVEYEAIDGWLPRAEQAAIAAEHPRYNVQYRRNPDCYWCNDRRCIVGPGYALVRCPRCAGGAWWPPFPAPLAPGPELHPEVDRDAVRGPRTSERPALNAQPAHELPPDPAPPKELPA